MLAQKLKLVESKEDLFSDIQHFLHAYTLISFANRFLGKPRFFTLTIMLAKSFNLNGGQKSQSCSSDVLKEEATSLPYGNFPVPFARASQTVKRFKPGTCNDLVIRKSAVPSQTSSRVVDTFTDLESRLGNNANRSKVEEISDTVQGSNLKITGMEGLPHPNQISGKRKRQNTRRPSTTSGNDINEHLLQLQRKKQLLVETKPVESVRITRDQVSNDSALGPPNPNVVLETTKHCFLTFGTDATLSWTTSRVSSLSSAGLAREGNALSSSAMPWEGLVASVQRQVVCAGAQQDGVVAVRTDRKRKLQSTALESPLDHFLGLYRNSLQQASDDDDDKENEFSPARLLGSRPQQLAFSKGNMFASKASTGMGNDFLGQRSPFVSAGRSTMVIKDQIRGMSEHAADWSHELPYQTYEVNDDNIFLREE